MVNRSVTGGLGAAPLPALELRGGVPAHLRTLVAVPTMLTTAAAIEEQIRHLEVHHTCEPRKASCISLSSPTGSMPRHATRRR